VAVNFYPKNRRPLLLHANQDVPTVDILVPTYNESPDLLEVTLRACMMVRYPEGRLQVYLCDDGGTEQKSKDADPAKRHETRQRKTTLQTLCASLGVHYVTREKNVGAKAGNLNAALEKSYGDLILILDADHVPTVDILERTVQWFIDQEDVFLVQTPHFMVNPDPIDRNLLQAFRRMPSENDMFYMAVQKGLDSWDSTFFCGSAALLRRKHIDLIGGIVGESITEDAETALDLHQRGFRSIYIDHPMVGGLAPESFNGFVVQRMRWTQGMVQIMLLKLPQALMQLKWHQAMCYINSCSFWFFPFARLIFLFAPVAYLVFGLEVYNASSFQIVVYTVPHVVASYFITSILFQRTRWPLISELYEIMQSVYSVRALVEVLRNPRKPNFVVTPKGELLGDDFISPLIRPYYIFIGILMATFIAGFWRYSAYPESRDLTMVVLFWHTINFVILLAAFGALLERKQRRTMPRMPTSVRALFQADSGLAASCIVDDVSIGGAV
jgi:cellulose synthase (UDP-forming)